jgi:hypothetical protein
MGNDNSHRPIVSHRASAGVLLLVYENGILGVFFARKGVVEFVLKLEAVTFHDGTQLRRVNPVHSLNGSRKLLQEASLFAASLSRNGGWSSHRLLHTNYGKIYASSEFAARRWPLVEISHQTVGRSQSVGNRHEYHRYALIPKNKSRIPLLPTLSI